MNLISLLPLTVLFGGTYFTLALKGFHILKPRRVSRLIKSELKNKSALSSLMLALAGTLGVGNITGVAVGIALGGAGSVFWLLISSLFSSVLKYCEVALATDMANSEGMAGVIKRSFGKSGKPLSVIYAALCLLLSLTMGAALQAGSISECAEAAVGISPKALAIPFVFLVVFIISGGAKKIENAVKYIIPLTTIIYILMCLCVIVPNLGHIDSVLYDVITSAFDFKSAAGGIVGFMTSSAIKEGFARGMLSNEAGAGTSALAHARAGERLAAAGGVFGMLEVFFDTVVLCPLTAFTILLTSSEGVGLSALLNAFSGRIPISSVLLFICIFFFAISTILCWFYYGESCFRQLFKKAPRLIYLIIFTISATLGLFFSSVSLIPLCDSLLFLMTLITLSTLIKNTKRIRDISYVLIK